MSVTVQNTTASLSGKTLAKLEDAQTFTGQKTFDIGASAPFVVVSGAAKVDNLDADKLDGQTGSYYTNVGNMDAGTLAVARGGTNSTATPTAGGVGYGTGSAHAYTSAGTAGQIVLSGGAGAPTFKNDELILKKGNSGTTTTAAAENVDTYAFAAAELTAKDTIIVELTIEAVTQQTASVVLYNNTDAVAIVDVWDAGLGAFPAGREAILTMKLRQLQSAATAVMGSGVGGTDANGALQTQALATFATAWTGAWTLALRQGGVTAGGTFKWSWSVYVLKGQ